VKPWQLLSLLLQYPDRELLEARDELADASAVWSGIQRFLAGWHGATLPELQRRYVETFDFDRRASLHLTYHVLGDKRQRGIELVRLKRRYAAAGLPLTGGELPDFLPVLLEFAALAPESGEALLNELRAPLEVVRARLYEHESPYALLLDALVDALPKPTPAQVEAARRLAADGPPVELVGLEPFAGAAS
jgi:nitrate reductase delta subunit